MEDKFIMANKFELLSMSKAELRDFITSYMRDIIKTSETLEEAEANFHQTIYEIYQALKFVISQLYYKEDNIENYINADYIEQAKEDYAEAQIPWEEAKAYPSPLLGIFRDELNNISYNYINVKEIFENDYSYDLKGGRKHRYTHRKSKRKHKKSKKSKTKRKHKRRH